MHEIKLKFEESSIKVKSEHKGLTPATKLLKIHSLFDYPIELLVPATCMGLTIYDGDAKPENLIHELFFVTKDDEIQIITKNGTNVGSVEL